MSGPEKFHSVFARNCEIRRIDRELAASFLNVCHLYGDCAAAYRYGLFVSRSPGGAKGAAEGGAVGSAEGCAVGAAEGRQTYPVGTLVAVASF